jgi:RimJ/RimL family protein N-acetyltransferase
MRHDLIFIEGRNLILRPLLDEDYSDEYLTWLNDPVTNHMSQRRPYPCDRESMRGYAKQFSANPDKGFVLAMIRKSDDVHVGNIALVNVQLVNRCAEIAILIGRIDARGQGLGGEAVYLLTRHGFEAMNLHRIFAGSFNPAFVRCVEKIGWVQEGLFRERIWSGGRYNDQIWLGQLRRDFKILPHFEPEAESL